MKTAPPKLGVSAAATARFSSSREPRKPPLRILKIAPTSFFADYGCHVRILEETLALQRLGHQIRICTYPTGRDLPNVTTCRPPRVPKWDNVRIGSSRRKPYLDLLLAGRCVLEIARQRPHLVHAHLHDGALVGYLVSRFCRVPLVFDFQGSMTSEMVDHGFLRRDSIWYGPLRRIEGIIDRFSDAIITSSSHAARLVVDEFGCSPEKVHPVPDCVNVETFRPRWEVPAAYRERLRRQLGIPEGRKVVVYLGLLAEYQGSGLLLQAAASLLRHQRSLHFLIMGYPGQERYREMARRLGILEYVTFTGPLPYEQAPHHLALGDVAVSPKMSATEGNGKLLNYMAVGLPSLAFDTPVNRELLGDAGVYAPLGDVAALTDRLEEMLLDEGWATGLGRALRERAVRCYSWEGGCHRVLEVYRQVGCR